MANNKKESQNNDSTAKTSVRKEAAKELGKTEWQGIKDSAKGIVDTAKGFVSGGVLGAARSAAGAIGSLVKDNVNLFKNLFKVIFNDSSIYGGNVPLPINELRPMDMINYRGVAENSTMGFVPKLSELYINMFSFDKSSRFIDNIDALFEDMRLALRSNLTYSVDDVKRFVLNNISLYIVAKYYEKRLGFTKYEDPQFAEFHPLWKTNELGGSGYNIYHELSVNPDFSADDNLASTLDIYEELVQSAFRFVLPVNMKQWVDHYIGSLFVLDDDTANPKYISLVPCNIPFYKADGTVEYMGVNGLTVRGLKEIIDNYRHDNIFNTIRADIIKIPTLSDSRAVRFEFAVGWLTPYTEYVPTPIIDVTFKQALINGYTTKSMRRNGFIRIDLLPENNNDDLTTLLFLGATYNDTDQADVFKAYGISVEKLVVKIYASATNPVQLAPGMVQSGAATFTDLFALALTSEVSSDVYVNAELTTTGRIYYPSSNPYELGTGHVADLATDPYSISFYDMDGHVGLSDAYLGIPICKMGSSYMFLITISDMDAHNTMVINSGNLTKVMYIAESAVNPLSNIGRAIRNHEPVLLTASDVALFGNATESFGRIGTITWMRSGFANQVVIDIHSATFAAQQSQSQVTYYWFTNCLWPNGDFTNQYIEGATVASDKITSHAGYVNYPQWIFAVLGYCIPVLNSLTVHTTIGSTVNNYVYNMSMLKEDYVPTLINVEDIPAVMSKMLAGLTKFHK